MLTDVARLGPCQRWHGVVWHVNGLSSVIQLSRVFVYRLNKKSFCRNAFGHAHVIDMTPACFEHATFRSGVGRATIAPWDLGISVENRRND